MKAAAFLAGRSFGHATSSHDKDPMSNLATIPTIGARTIQLFELWAAALALGGHGSVYVHESDLPGAADALRAWSGAEGFAAEEQVMLTSHSPPYVTLHVYARGISLAVIKYRDATEEEEAKERARIATKANEVSL